MPLSEKQLAANRANSTGSTGPTSASDRRNASRNSTRHGILASVVLLEGQSSERFAALVNSFIAEFLPETYTDVAIIQKLAVAHWRLMRTWALESARIPHEIKLQAPSLTDEDFGTRAMLAFRSLGDKGSHDLISHYEHRFDRQHYRALEAFHKIATAKKPAPNEATMLKKTQGWSKITNPFRPPSNP